MKVNSIMPIFPANYQKRKAFAALLKDKTVIINAETGDKQEFDDPVEAWEYVAKLDA